MTTYAIASLIFCASVAACGGDEFRTDEAVADAGGEAALVPIGDASGESSAEDGGRLPGIDAARPDSLLPYDGGPADHVAREDAHPELDAGLEGAAIDARDELDLVDANVPEGAQDAPAAPCGPSSCSGCCDGAGRCEAGTLATACGSAGIACMDCLPAFSKCVAGGLCAY